MAASVASEPMNVAAAKIANDPATHWVWLGAAILILAGSFLFGLDSEGEGVVRLGGRAMPALCHLKRLTGIDCPGCGLTRSFVAIAHARFAEAWRFNPAGPLWFVLIGLQIPYRAYQLRRLRAGCEAWDPGVIGSTLFATACGALVLQWALRQCGVL